MLPFADSIAVWGAATLASVIVGITLIVLIGPSISPRYLAAFGIGVFLWFFVDTLEGSSDLVVGEGFGGGAPQAAAVILFALGAVSLLTATRAIPGNDPAVSFAVPLVAAAALGLHGLGEGSAFGSAAALTSSGSLVGAFGGVIQGAAYALHKLIEPMMVGALYSSFSRVKPRAASQTAGEVMLLAVVFTAPSMVGAAVGYSSAVDATYFYALGAGASVYALFTLSRQAMRGSDSTGLDSLRFGLALLAGFILIYLAALLHS